MPSKQILSYWINNLFMYHVVACKAYINIYWSYKTCKACPCQMHIISYSYTYSCLIMWKPYEKSYSDLIHIISISYTYHIHIMSIYYMYSSIATEPAGHCGNASWRRTLLYLSFSLETYTFVPCWPLLRCTPNPSFTSETYTLRHTPNPSFLLGTYTLVQWLSILIPSRFEITFHVWYCTYLVKCR